ncbi:hypothetical protein IE81DRAFT_78418 [Ceraceosorus guamensis]|uniref:Uncharacterized protein n=1 Tax=Ceraceosorus guamensis TaxID=1522189 RepID=A0A316VMI2_9BASI|nr:hypothetical protein IE81DRAFT_78418 [Ceraceosorus guamensis]PWN38757.1 hypothetical protein IE81DRAFT_78418 [Ceraceosorus guamensis]
MDYNIAARCEPWAGETNSLCHHASHETELNQAHHDLSIREVDQCSRGASNHLYIRDRARLRYSYSCLRLRGLCGRFAVDAAARAVMTSTSAIKSIVIVAQWRVRPSCIMPCHAMGFSGSPPPARPAGCRLMALSEAVNLYLHLRGRRWGCSLLPCNQLTSTAPQHPSKCNRSHQP